MPTLTAKQDGKYKVNGFDTVTVNVTGGGGSSPSPATATPIMDGVGAVGTSAKYAREDHVHPSDTSKVDKVSGKGLSTNDFTDTLKNKLDGIASGAEVNQNAFSNVKVGNTTIAADSKTDTLELIAGTNVTLTPNASNDSVTISASGGGGSSPDPATAVPLMDGTAAVGSSTKYAREDHVHPSDTSKVDAVSGMGLSHNDLTDALLAKLNGISTGANKVTFTVVSGSVDNISISNTSYQTASISIAVPTGSSRAAMFYRGASIANATSSGSNSANCGVCWYFYDADTDTYKVNIRNFKSSTAKVKVTLYLTAAIIE